MIYSEYQMNFEVSPPMDLSDDGITDFKSENTSNFGFKGNQDFLINQNNS